MDFCEIKRKRDALHDEIVLQITEKVKSCRNNEYVFKENDRPYFYYNEKKRVIKVGLNKEEGIFFHDLCFYVEGDTFILACITPVDTLLRILSYMEFNRA